MQKIYLIASLVAGLTLLSGCIQSTVETTSENINTSNDIENIVDIASENPGQDAMVTETGVEIISDDGLEEKTVTEIEGNVKEFNIVATQYNYEPSTITVNEGDTVIINFTSTDVEHGISISEFGVSEVVSPGEITKIEFIADKSGTYTMSCNVYCGSGHSSMEGTLIVE
ncbi:MAG: cupredoxin domain-containing protein [bacterium]|nr:cupredoxin domain-containing protein [bacterium]